MKDRENLLTQETDVTQDKEALSAFMLVKRQKEPILNTDFQEALHQKLMRTVKQNTKQNTKFFLPYLLRPALVMATLLVIFAISFTFLNRANLISVAEAKEEIKKQLDRMLQKDTIFHQKSILISYEDGKAQAPITYEIWEDQNSPRLKNIVNYPNSTTFQVHDGDNYWDYNTGDNTLYKEIYVFENPADKEVKLGSRVDLIEKYKSILESQALSISQETVNNTDAWVISEETTTTGADNQTYIQVIKHAFAKETFQLLVISRYKKMPEALAKQQEVDFQIVESLPRNRKNLENLFKFDFPLPPDVRMVERTLEGVNKTESEPTTFELSPKTIDLSDGQPTHTISATSQALDINSKIATLGQYETEGDTKIFIERYNLINVRGLATVDPNPKTTIAADIPDDVQAGTYYLKITLPNGESYIFDQTVEILNNRREYNET
ncbi:hypothetical protein HYU92_06815 [Candidatus Curtissbacteria bacterium]|nr:hypothetical protein [Candidatus Curtissbacteria bacterium]